MAASKACTLCQQTTTGVWRVDKETKSTVCNPCFIKKYPPAVDENGEVATKRRKIQSSEELAKEDKKEKIKEEMKEEMKEEIKDEAANDLDDIFGAATEAKVKKKKTHSVSEVQDNGQPPEVSVESDTEYPEADLAALPDNIVIQASGHSKVDGKYDKMPKACRGRGCYFTRKKDKHGVAEDKISYLYWCKKMWRVGAKFGDSRSFAKAKEVPKLMECLEPYPHPWEVHNIADSSWNSVAGMRIFDLKASTSQPHLPKSLMLPSQKVSSGLAASGSADAGAQIQSPERRHKKNKKVKKEKKETVDVKEEVKKEGDAATASSQKEEIKKEDSSEDSDSSSKQSSSEQSSSSSNVAQPEAGQVESETDKELRLLREQMKQAAKDAEMAKKATQFQEKLRNEVSKQTNPQARNKKLTAIKGMLEQKADNLLSVAGMTPDMLANLISSLMRDFWTPEETPAANANPKEKMIEVRDLGMDPSHRICVRVRGVIKKRGQRTQTSDYRMSTRNDVPTVDQIFIASHRLEGEKLWYQQPGSVVECDSCSREVPQSMGALQGAVGKSQFAQDEFLCSDCMGSVGMMAAMQQQQQQQQQFAGM